ncbi:MAG: Fur family transcriptional regulator [Alphaproteobacteria bacterium]
MKHYPRTTARSDEGAVFRAPGHDHGRCVAEALGRAESISARRGARLTALRRRVLELVWTSHAPIGAYDILERLRRAGRRAAPIAVYRALAFLMELGLVHRLASVNAYLGCGGPTARHSGQFLICERCGSVAELSNRRIDRAIAAGAASTGFKVLSPLVEVRGRCPGCRTREDGDDG